MGAVAIHAVKKGSESNERLMNRFKKQVQEARFMKTLRAKMRYLPPLTKREFRLRALMREGFRKKNQKQKFYSNI